MKRTLAMIAVICLALTLVPAVSLLTTADTVCPQMPLGATNYATVENMEVTGDEPAVYANGGLLIPTRESFDGTYGYGIVRVNLPDEVTAAKPYVLSFWTLEPADGKLYTVRFFGDSDGNYYEMQYANNVATLVQNGINELQRFTLPSTGKGLASAVKTNNLGHFHRIDIYIRPAAAGTMDASFFIDGEAMRNVGGSDTVNLTGDKPLLVLGDKGAAVTVRGLRYYEVDPPAESFEPQIDPIAEITAAPNATAGTGFLASMNPMAAVATDDMLLPHYNPADDEEERDNTCPRMPLGTPNFAIGAASTVSNAKNEYDAVNGYISLISSNWSTARWTLTPVGINPDDDIMVSFILKRPYSWGANYQTMITFGSDGVSTQKINFTISENTTYTGADGSVRGMAAATSGAGWTNGVKIDLHLYPNGHGSRTIDVFAGGSLLSRIKNQAILPFVWEVAGASNTSYPEEFCGLRIYKNDDNATAFYNDQAASQDQEPLEATPGLVDLISNNWWAKTVASTPTRLYESNEFNLTGIIDPEVDDAYVISAWMQSGTALWQNATAMLFATDATGEKKYNVQLRFPGENSGKFSVNEPTTTGFGRAFLPNGISGVASTYYKIAVFLRHTADGWTYRVYVNDILQTALGERNMGETLYPYLRFAGGMVAGVRLYKVDPDTVFSDKGFRRSGEEINTDDTTPPAVLGVTDDAVYSETQRYITVVDVDADGISTLASVTVNGSPAQSVGNKTYLIPTTVNGAYQIVATDLSGNSTTVNFTSNYRPTYAVQITWANMPYVLTGTIEAGLGEHTGVKTFHAYEGDTVTITAADNEEMVGSVKNGSWGWLSNDTYSYVVDGDRSFVIQGFATPVLTIETEGEGTVTNVKAGHHRDGYGFTAIAVPAEGWHFDHFTFTTTADSVTVYTASAALAMNGNSTLTAVFVENALPTVYEVQITWANMPYVLTGTIDAGLGEHTGVNTFHAYEGDTVTITAADNDEMVGAVKNESWGWLTNDTYSYVVEGDRAFVIQGSATPVLTIETEGEGTVTNVTAGHHQNGFAFTAIAVPAEGWHFDHFTFTTTADSVTVYTASAALAMNGNSTLTAVFVQDAPPTYSVTITAAVGGTATGAASGISYGDTVTLTATADSGYVFRYWLIGGRMYRSASVTLPVTADVEATPVFENTASEDYTVSFFTCDSRLIATIAASALDVDNLPEVPERYGYTALGWAYVWGDGISSDIDVYPQYIKDSSTFYTVEVTGGIASAITVPFETRVTVTATTTVGFVGWKNAADEIVSVRPVYSFFVVDDVELTAVYEGAKPAYIITVQDKTKNVSTSDSAFRLSVIGETFVDEGYTMLERGIVYATGDQTEETLVIGGTGVKKKVSSLVDNGQFMYTLNNAPKSAVITARAYMIIKDTLGNQQTVYSGLCDATFEG